MSLLKSRGESKKSATVLSVLPESSKNETGLRPGQRKLLSHTNPQNLEIEDNRLGLASRLESVFHTRSLSGTLGTYKLGRKQRQNKDRESAGNPIHHGHIVSGISKPNSQVVIPTEKPLPALPFFTSSSKNDVSPNSSKDAHDVSPPSADHRAMRHFIMSPLDNVQPHNTPFEHTQHPTSHGRPKSRTRTTKQQKNTQGFSTSSNDSQESDTSSVRSVRSSRTSVETHTGVVPAKTTKPSRSQANIQEPLVTTSAVPSTVATSTSKVASTNQDYCIPPSMVPPRRYAQHTLTEEDVSFQRTCETLRTRSFSTSITRKPTLTRRSSKRARPRRSLTGNPKMGAINEAVNHSTSKQISTDIRVASPTLSQAEEDLEEELTLFTRGQEDYAKYKGELDRCSPSQDCPFVEEGVVAHKDITKVENSLNHAIQPRKDSGTLETSNDPPAVPRKSSKRKSTATSRASRTTLAQEAGSSSPMCRVRSHVRGTSLKLAIPEYKRMTEEFFLSPIEIPSHESRCTITPGGAESVVLGILRSFDHLDVLFATAVVNCGFYRVFKRYELDLIKCTLRRMSPSAWEFREIAFPGHDLLHAEDLERTRPDEEYTPTMYLQLQKRDVKVIRTIKSQIMEKCQSFLRLDMSFSLMNENPTESARADNALWRIWSFCKIFGSGKGREEDIVAQMDWLKGGLLAHQDACTSSFMTTDYMNDTLLGVPESFGKGNEGGLTAEELFDMMELWNCLGVLLQGFEGRTAQARKAGVYDCTDVRGGDIDGEETMLDEWCYYLLTLGLSTILELAVPCRRTDCSAFMIASQKGWVNWKAPVFGGTRRNFLKEAASRVYEDKIANTYAKTSTRDLQRHQSKLRIQKHISELRHRKNNESCGPMISMSEERPMSVWSTVINSLERPSSAHTAASNIVSHIPSLSSSLAQDLSPSVTPLPTAGTPSPLGRSVAQPLLPTPSPSTVPSSRDRYSIAASMPSIEEHPAHIEQGEIPEMPLLTMHPAFRHGVVPFRPPRIEIPSQHTGQCIQHRSDLSHYSRTTNHSSSRNVKHPAFQQHQAQMSIYDSESHENTADKAIYRIVEMGFTADQAREALRVTDEGIGLRIDRAVELLLSRQT